MYTLFKQHQEQNLLPQCSALSDLIIELGLPEKEYWAN